METITPRAGHDLNLASRKAREAAERRFQATQWLESLVGPLGISNQPTEREFISCLRNGLILCKAINKIQPGCVPKVVETSQFPSQSLSWDSQPLPAYQFFENVRNFLKAAQELNLAVFEASVFERDNVDAGSSAKVVDCILGLKAYNDWKQISGGNGSFKHAMRSPLVMHLNGRLPPREATGFDAYRRLDLSVDSGKLSPTQSATQKIEDSLVKALAECMIDAKENIDENLLACSSDMDPIKSFGRILSSTLEERLQSKFPECCRACLSKGSCNHWLLFRVQEGELRNLKALLSSTKEEFGDLHSQLQSDLKQLASLVEELSTAAIGYHKVANENRALCNMVQDLKGNIRVCCRIRPAFNADARNVVDFIGEDGSLVVFDPSKPHIEGKKLFQLNRIFGPTATQVEVFKEAQPLIRSVIDGYNVCILAYGQKGSGKTHTMCGPSGGSAEELGINYLALNDLLELSKRKKDVTKYELHVQMVEIYNENVRDLLCGDPAAARKLEIRSCTTENVLNLPDATMHSVKSTVDVLDLMKFGEVNRAVSSTALNNQSSRSHSILTVHVHGKDLSGGTPCSCLHLVDLEGSERVDKSEVTGEGLKEAQHINKSLSCLEDVITALAQKNSCIPDRNSKLTLLLQNSLGGNAKMLMFAHVSPEEDFFAETVSTLNFAQWASTVELGKPSLHKGSMEVMDLKEQIENLKKQLANKETQSVQRVNRSEEPRSPFQKPKAKTIERTPPRSRRLSIENKGIVSPKVGQPQSRRLSLAKVSESAIPLEKTVQLPPPKSPTTPNSAFKRTVVKTEGRTKIPSLVLQKTPEPQVPIRKEITMSSKIKTADGNGKSSHIRKSLRTIGKLIYSSDKRVQHKVAEMPSPRPVLPSASRPSRRQSLTGIQQPERSKGSSFGGADTCGNQSRKAKTPPPVHPSTKIKQWM